MTSMTHPIKSPKKLIEVALPLDAINVASAREKSIRHGHPSTLHLWWARRPLATARAVIFAQLVNAPGYQQGGRFKYGKNKAEAAEERKRLFGIIERLVLWENTTNEEVLEEARAEIRRSWREVCELNCGDLGGVSRRCVRSGKASRVRECGGARVQSSVVGVARSTFILQRISHAAEHSVGRASALQRALATRKRLGPTDPRLVLCPCHRCALGQGPCAS